MTSGPETAIQAYPEHKNPKRTEFYHLPGSTSYEEQIQQINGVQTFLHVGKPFLQLVIHLWTKGKVIHENNTAREQMQSIYYTLYYTVSYCN